MSTALLARRPQVAATELDEARSTVGPWLRSHQLGPTRRDGRPHMVHAAGPTS